MTDRSQPPRLVTSLTPEFLNPPRRKRRPKAAPPVSKAPSAAKPKRRKSNRRGNLQMESLEPRQVLNASPTLAEVQNVTLQAGAPFIVPLDGFDSDGDALTFTVQSSNPAVTGSLMNGRGLKMSVQGFGDMVFQLFEDLAPRAAGRIAQLAESGFYNGVIFHRVINNFVIQGGDPTGSGSGGSQLGDFDDDYHPDLQHTSKGLLSMAKAGDDTNDSQFFVTEVATRNLDFNHSIFGKLIEGESVRDAISNVATDDNDKPLSEVKITSATVFNDTQNRSLMLKAPIGTTGTSTITVTADDGKGGTVQRTFQVTVVADTTNNTPFLLPVEGPVQVVGDTPKVLTVRAQDVENNPVFYAVRSATGVTVQIGATQVNPVNQIAETTLTITRTANFTGNASFRLVTAPAAGSFDTPGVADSQLISVSVLASAPSAPTSVKLSATSDTGASSTDGVTQKNNTSGATMSFEVTGVTAGAVVKVFDGTTLLGEATATGTTVVVTSNGTAALTDGVHSIVATQAIGSVVSPASTPVAITVDARQSQFTSTPITTIFAGAAYSYNVQNDEEGTAGFLFGLISPPAGMTINAQTGEIAWTPTAQQIGPHSIVIRATDLAGNFIDQSFTLTVENSAPTLNPIGAKSVDELAALNFTASATDPNLPSDTLTFSLEAGAPAGATINATTGAFSWTPTESQGGQTFAITIRVTDLAGQFDNETIQVTVNEVNVAPVLATIGDKGVVKDQLLTFTAVGTDSDLPTQALTYSLAAGAPAGAAINATTGVFTWTPNAGQSPGTYTITVRVSDGTVEDSEQISVFVQDAASAPVLPTVTHPTVDEGQTVAINLGATDVNLPHDRLTYAIVSGPAAATINPSGQFSWVTTEADGPGTHIFTVQVTDALGLSDTVTFGVTVNEINAPPVLSPIGDRTVNEGEVLTFSAVGVDADLPANTLTYSLASGAPTGATINPTTGLFQWQTTETDGGQSFTITVRVSDGTVETSETITVTVAEVNQAPVLAPVADQTVDEGGAVEFTASATDADLPVNTLTYTLDAGAPAGATIDAQSGEFRWETTEADGPGTYTITIRASDGLGLSDSETFTVTVNEINVAPTLADIDDVTVNERSPISFAVEASDADLPANTLTYSLAAGAPAGAAIHPTTGAFLWTPTEAQGPGTFDITVIVTDAGGLSDSKTFTVTVIEVDDPPVIEEIADRTVNLGSTLTIDVVASDPDVPSSGALEYSLTSGAPAGMTIDAATGKITWTPSATQDGQSFDVTVRVEDGDGLFDEETFRVSVNAAPVLDDILDQTIDEATLLALTARATDTDAVTYSLGDGAPNGMSIDPTTGALRWTPTEADGPGEFEITVIATDAGGLTDQQTFQVTVREVNVAPVIDPVDDQTINAGQELTFTVAARDVDLPGQNLRFSLDPGAPAGATIDPVTGEFRWLVPVDFTESSVEIVIRVTDDGPGGLSATITVQVALTDVGLALFTTSGASGIQGTASANSLSRTRNVSAVVAQQSAARAAAAAEVDRFDIPLDAADLAYFAGRIFRFGPEDGGGGPVPKSNRDDENENQPREQRSLKPPIEDNAAPPTSGRTAPKGSQPISNLDRARNDQALREPPAAAPVMDEMFKDWDDNDAVPADAESSEAAVVAPNWIDEAATDAMAEDQSQQTVETPAQASLGMLAIPLVAGELLQRRRQKHEEESRRKPR